jgi:N-acetylneuraminic acid mutarotase
MFVSVALLPTGILANATPPALAQASGTWTTTGSLNTPRGGHTATLLANGQVLVVGGKDATGFLTSAELYNPATGQWTVTGSTATPRLGHSATLLPNGGVLVAGGYLGVDSNYQAIYTASAELFNPATGRWTTTGSMTVPRSSHGATLLQNARVLVAGGNSSVIGAGTSAEIYDPSVGTWRATGSMHTGHSSTATLLQDGRALVADSTGELYDPSTGQWMLTAKMYYSEHTGVSTALLASGYVLIYGNHLPSYASEFYNPVANTWTGTKGQNSGAISNGPLALLGTGKVLLAGGSTKYPGVTTNCMLYDPSTNTWLVTGSLRHAVAHTLTRLMNGQALAVGSSDAELYTP